MCVSVNNTINDNKKLKRISKKRSTTIKPLQKAIWVDPFDGETDDDSDDSR